MIAAFILVISAAALGQFAVYSWRAGVLSAAGQPISERTAAAMGISSNSLQSEDFATLQSLHNVCPGLEEASRQLRLVTAYYHTVRSLGRLFGSLSPTCGAWANREQATCTRYVAVSIDQRLRNNQAQLASVCSY
jgi:hypothetical protein